MHRIGISQLCVFSLGLLLLSGCGGDAGGIDTYPVTGKITKGGSGVKDIKVTLAPRGDTQAPMLVGVTGDDGTFEIMTNAGQKGAPAGEYKVVLTPPQVEHDYSSGEPPPESKNDVVPEKLQSEQTSDESLTVKADGENVINIDLK